MYVIEFTIIIYQLEYTMKLSDYIDLQVQNIKFAKSSIVASDSARQVMNTFMPFLNIPKTDFGKAYEIAIQQLVTLHGTNSFENDMPLHEAMHQLTLAMQEEVK